MPKLCTRMALLCVTFLAIAGPVSAEQKYTYVKASLGFPWFMFFVFLALIAIPFLMIIYLSWRQYPGQADASQHIKPEGLE